MAGIRELATRGRCIPVVIGQVPHSRWSAESGYEPASGEFRQEFVTAP
jgi:hypothetical protein